MFKTERAEFLIDNLDLPAAAGVSDAVWEHFQIAHLSDDSLFRIERKSRQIAWSFLSAAEAVADAILNQRDSLFGSINLEEAKEKIRYARAVYENLNISDLPRLIIENQLELEFETGVRLTSFPSKPIRGRPRSNVYLDEFAHVQRDRQIYKGSLPVISKGGRIRIGSSPLGASGLFWEIFAEPMQKYPDYQRKTTPWWEVAAFSNDPAKARTRAPAMQSFERLEYFGKDRIKAIFANMPLEDFQQEFECVFVDESTAWISWREIAANQNAELVFRAATVRDDQIGDCFAMIDEVAALACAGKIEAQLAVGGDIGRTRNASEFFAIGLGQSGQFPLRLALTLNNCSFEAQESVLKHLFKSLPVVGGFLDQNGLGRNLAENLMREFPYKVRGVDFTNESKKLWASDVKMLFQKQVVPIPIDRDLAYQIHSIKKIVSPAKNLIFDTARNEKHHADKFWALALALAAARREWLVDDPAAVGSFSFSL